MNASALIAHLDTYLNRRAYPDSSNNGLQVQGAADIATIAFAVDGCMASIKAAAKARAQLLIVHHGLFWSEHLQITGAHYARVKALLDAGIGLYASHIPLDAHAEVGNNIQLARMAGLTNIQPWGAYKGSTIGFIGDLPKPLDVRALSRRVAKHIGKGNRVQGGGLARRVAVCSGFGVSFLDEALAAGADTLITGETSHQWFHSVAEQPLNVIFGGHYNTETVGLKALAAHLVERFGVQAVFIDLPTGL